MASQPCITIIGTGLIGTSIGMAIQKARGKEILVLGHDRDLGQARLAQRMGGVHKVERYLRAACAQADMIVIAVPADQVREILALIAPDLKSGCVITDTTSVKVPVIEWADEYLGDEISFVGGDPILFGDEAGIESARADLLEGALYAITPSAKASSESVKLVTDLIVMLGALPHFIDPHEHDGLIGGTEHLADVLAVVLLRTLSTSGGWRDMRQMAGATFDRVTCFSQAESSEYVSRAMLNKANLLRWIDAFLQQLDDFRRLVAADNDQGIQEIYEQEMETRLAWLRDRATGEWGNVPDAVKLPTPGEFFSQMLFGGLSRRRDRS
jgi:prephenate dehydrogenase